MLPLQQSFVKVNSFLTWKTSLAHFLQRLCWQGKITTGLVNISRHMGQISCFSKFSMALGLDKTPTKTDLHWTCTKKSSVKVRFWEQYTVDPKSQGKGVGRGVYPAGVRSLYLAATAVKCCLFYLAHIWNRPGRHWTAAFQLLNYHLCPIGGDKPQENTSNVKETLHPVQDLYYASTLFSLWLSSVKMHDYVC